MVNWALFSSGVTLESNCVDLLSFTVGLYEHVIVSASNRRGGCCEVSRYHDLMGLAVRFYGVLTRLNSSALTHSIRATRRS